MGKLSEMYHHSNQSDKNMLQIATNYEEGLFKMMLDGEADASSSIELDETIRLAYQENKHKIMIDCDRLRYISSAGVGVFVSHLEDFEQKGGAFVFYQMKPNIQNVFEVLGLHKFIAIFSTESQAKSFFLNKNSVKNSQAIGK